MPNPEQAAALEDQDVQEAIVEACCRECCVIDGLDPDVLTRDVDAPEDAVGSPVVPAWTNYRRLVLRVLVITGTASSALADMTALKAAGAAAAARAPTQASPAHPAS